MMISGLLCWASSSFPYTTLFRSARQRAARDASRVPRSASVPGRRGVSGRARVDVAAAGDADRGLWRSEEHTSELQSHVNLVCRLLFEKKKQRMMRSGLI